MRRALLAVVISLMPVLGMLSLGGCEDKTVTVQQSEQRTESEPKMKSPGKMVVE